MQELVLHSITAIYAVCNVVRLLFYVPQLVAVARDPLGAYAISLSTWTFWSFSHAVTTVYCGAVVDDLLLAGMMLGNTLGSCAVVALTARKRYAHARSRRSLIPGR
ncbi:MAG TPA: hypothetical protein VES91_07950 [Burkholderiaceae bacterium]|nr:hypothetical protein [Burkholderiaceae bacterium]